MFGNCRNEFTYLTNEEDTEMSPKRDSPGSTD